MFKIKANVRCIDVGNISVSWTQLPGHKYCRWSFGLGVTKIKEKTEKGRNKTEQTPKIQ